jgi:signal transduction histidine kinase
MAEHEGTLHELLRVRRQELIDRWGRRIRTAVATEPLSTAELVDHMPRFVDDLVAVLHPDALPFPGAGTESAVQHGAQRLRLGFDVAEVVREYGILHQCILQLAAEAGLVVGLREQEVLARWLNGGIAVAVSQYVAERDMELQRQAAAHLGFIAHEVRNPLSAARLALASLRRRDLVAGGPVVDRLERNLRRTAEVVDSTLTHSWLKLGVPVQAEPITLAPFLEEIRTDADGESAAKGIRVEVAVDPELRLEADPRLLRSSVTNLLLNAIKFSHPSGHVRMSARGERGRMLIEVSDSCGGLPPGKTQELFAPVVQRGVDRSGFGLGLAIALQAAEAHGGTVRVDDRPGDGCTFTIDVPAGS